MTDSRPLRLTLGPSRLFAGLIVALHVAGALSATLVLDFVYGLPIGLLLLSLGIVAARDCALLKAGRSICALDIFETGEAVIEHVDGSKVRAQLGPRRHVSRLWVAMEARGARRGTLFVVHDMVSRPAFRALCMWALWSRWPRSIGDLPSR